MVNVCVLGENSAIASLEIQQIETAPTFWVLGDSTVTDGNCSLPFFRLQNYTGVGTGLTKYLPTTMAMVNEGEGGLNAADNYHFNMVSSRIKEGDYMYVEYGHNHKDDGASGYKTYLDKYYNVAHAAGAKLIIVSPIERINTWDADTNTYQHSLRDFATTGEAYVSEKIAAGATDIAYVDLNQYSLDFYNKIVADNGNDSGAIKFYFQTANGGSTDQTHPNDAGAENLAYEFFKAAKAVTDTTQQAVLAGFLDDMTDETPNLVPTSITSLGAAPNSAWPNYTSPVSYPYPVVIEGVNFDESGVLTSVDVKTQPSSIVMDSYGIIIVTIYNEDGTEKGKIYAKDQVDNSSGNGPQTIENFTTGVTLGENDTYTAIVMKAKDAGGETGLIVDEDANLAYSATYKPTEIEKVLITNEDGDGAEDFDYYGASYDGTDSLSNYNSWTSRGSAGITLTLGEDDDETKYATIKSDGAKNGTANQGSFYVAKDFVTDEETSAATDIGTSGRYLISADIKYVSGGGMVTRFVTGNTSKEPWGTASIDLFTVGSNGVVTAGGTEIGSVSATDFTNVSYTLDMDAGKAYVSVGGSDEKEITVSNYATLSTDITPTSLTGFMFGGDKVAFDMQVANLTVAKLKDSGAKTTLTVAVQQEEDESTPTYNVAVTADKVYEQAALIVAEYNADKTLKKVSVTDKALTEGENKFEVAADENSKIMLWDGLDTMKPFTVTATKKVVEPEVLGTVHIGDDTETVTTTTTVAQGSTVKAVAVPEENCIFVKWVDASGTTISTESEIDLRLYKDLDLTAQFAKQGGVEDIVSFNVTGDKQYVKAGEAQTVNMTVSNVFDETGNPVKYSASDVTWSCDEPGITVENGVVTLTTSVNIGTDLIKKVPIKATINNITKTYELSLYGYDSYEGFDTTTGAWDFTGDGGAAVTDGYLQLLGSSGASKSYTVTKTLDSSVSSANKVAIRFNWKSLIESSKGRHSNFVLQDSDGNTVFVMRGNGSAGLYYSTTAAADSSTDGDYTKISTFNQNWYTVDLVIDFTAKTINGTISDTAGKVQATLTDVAITTEAANLAKMYAINTYSAAPLAIDDVFIKAY
jgi:hypothetical protein